MPTTQRPRIFLSYGVGDATEVAALLHRDLAARGYEVWQDINRIGEGRPWDEVVRDGLKGSQVLLALLSPQSVRRGRDRGNATQTDSVCLDEIAYARGACHIPIVPVKVMPCETPFLIYRLHQFDFQSWKSDAVYQSGIDRICQAIEAAGRGEARERSWAWLTSPWDFEPFLYEKRKSFQGREWLFEEIDDWRANGSQPVLLITGGPGAGKSAIVATLIHDNPDGQVLAYHCCQANTPATLDPANFVRNLAAMIAVRIEAYDGMLDDPAIVKALQGADDDPASAFEAAILAPLHKLPVVGEGRRYLLIDALDEAMTRSRQPTIVALLASRLERFPPWLRIVATTRPEQNVLAQLRSLTPTELHTHDPRNLGDIRSFIAARLKDPALHAAVEADGRLANELIEKLVAASNGNFLYATTALKAVEAGQLDFRTIERLPPGLSGIYQQFFDRIFGSDRPEVDFEPTRKVLETIVAAQESLTREQIAAPTGLDAKKQLPEILARLSSFVPVRESRYSIFHKSLSDWLTDWDQAGDHAVAGRYHVDRAEGRAQLAKWCWSEYKRGPEKASPYCLRYLAVHLHETGRDQDAQTALLDFDWLRSKLAATDANALIADCNLFSEDQSTTLLQDSLRLCAHLLSKDKTQLPAQLLGRLSAFREQSPAIQLLLEQASGWRGAAWLRPLTSSLTPPGSTLLRTLRGHTGRVNTIAVSSDGQFVVTASDDHTLKVWELTTGLVERTLEGHQDKVNDVALSPDGKFIISASSDKTVLVWPFRQAKDPRALGEHEDAVTAVAVTPDSRFVLSGSEAGLIVKWDLQNGRKVATLKGHTGAVKTLTIDREGRFAASISNDSTVKIWNLRNLQHATLVRELSASSFMDQAVALLPNGRCLAASKVWNIETGEKILTLEPPISMTGVLAVTPDGRHAMSTYRLQRFAVWDLETGAVIKQFGESFFVLSAIAVTPQERFVITATGNSPKVWDLQRPFLPSPHSDRLSAVAIKADESEAVSFSSDEQFRMWDLRTYQEKDIVLPPAGSKFLGFKPETLETLLMVHGDRLVLWDPRSNESKGILAECPGITHALLFPAMQRVVTANEGDKLVRLWHLGTGTMLKELAGHTDSVSALVAVPGTNCVLSASYDETMKLWDLETGNAIRTFEGHKGPVDVVVVTPDARQVVSASRDTTLKIWDLQTEETLHTLTGHTYSVHDVAVMREGRFVISVSGDSTAKAWSLSDGNLVAEYYADNPIHRCAVSSENGPIVLGDGLGRLHFLRLDGI